MNRLLDGWLQNARSVGIDIHQLRHSLRGVPGVPARPVTRPRRGAEGRMALSDPRAEAVPGRPPRARRPDQPALLLSGLVRRAPHLRAQSAAPRGRRLAHRRHRGQPRRVPRRGGVRHSPARPRRADDRLPPDRSDAPSAGARGLLRLGLLASRHRALRPWTLRRPGGLHGPPRRPGRRPPPAAARRRLLLLGPDRAAAPGIQRAQGLRAGPAARPAARAATGWTRFPMWTTGTAFTRRWR